ncbi:MAG TPA: hypothetical protein VEK07_15485 [Polyangiaceae bacterium]|nr:hypothetical protein [Polyangiaceae bacterium]
MRNVLWGLAALALSCSEQRFSSNPPLFGPEPAVSLSVETSVETGDAAVELAAAARRPLESTDGVEQPGGAADAGPIADAGALAGRRAARPTHALTVVACSPDVPSCPPSEADASAENSYRVVFGSGRGVLRSRGQAATDLYNELRDRTALGERVDAEVVLRDAIGSAPRGSAALRSTIRLDIAKNDPLARSAFVLLDLVDDRGEVTLDVVHWSAVSNCTVSLGASAGDGGSPQCLIAEPERTHRPNSALSW